MSNRPRVFVTRQLHGDALSALEPLADVEIWPESGPPSPTVLRDKASSCDALITMVTERIDDSLLDSAPTLRVVANVAVGYDNFDVPALTRHGVQAANTPDVLTNATADIAFGLDPATTRRIAEARDVVRNGQWITWDPTMLLGMELAGSTLGIIGFGRIGQAVAQRGAGFQMSTVAWSRHPKERDDVRFVELDELLATADVVSIHCALNAETTHLIGRRELALMKPTAFLINTARGPIVDQEALADALEREEIAGAGLDVTEVEPISTDDRLLSIERCVVLPHIGSATGYARGRMAEIAVENVIAGLKGELVPNCLNPTAREHAQ